MHFLSTNKKCRRVLGGNFASRLLRSQSVAGSVDFSRADGGCFKKPFALKRKQTAKESEEKSSGRVDAVVSDSAKNDC